MVVEGVDRTLEWEGVSEVEVMQTVEQEGSRVRTAVRSPLPEDTARRPPEGSRLVAGRDTPVVSVAEASAVLVAIPGLRGT